jgi:C1A family cysteine protease
MAYKIAKYGWRPSYPDPRNVPADTYGLATKSEVDPRDEMQAPYDQGQLGSCTANAYAAAVEYNDLIDGGSFGTPSRLAIYYGERLREGSVAEDSGAFGHDAFKDGREFGVGSEKLWPYEIDRFAEEPSREYLESRANYRIPGYKHPDPSIDIFKAVLSNRQTIAFGFTVYDAFESYEVAETGIVPMPTRGEQILGGHEVLIVGYLSAHPDHALVRNSWGTDWGMEGYFLMPWSYVVDRHYSADWRTIYRRA